MNVEELIRELEQYPGYWQVEGVRDVLSRSGEDGVVVVVIP